ncbi:MAG: hypothetical protein AMXMBFR53_21140 [Gemmatimonadota bacterium]
MDDRCLLAMSDAPALYAARALPGPEAEAFEDHLIGCGACQEAVREALHLTAALAAEGRRAPRVLRWGPAIALVAVLVGVLAWPSDAVRRLGRVDAPPEFRGLAVRVDPDSVATLGDRGMAAYVRGDFREAAELLGAAAEDAAQPGVRFFLGVSLLLDGRPGDAAAELTLALQPPGNPYEGEALYYLAKARLAQGDAEGALGALGSVDRLGLDGARASALADSIRSVLR